MADDVVRGSIITHEVVFTYLFHRVVFVYKLQKCLKLNDSYKINYVNPSDIFLFCICSWSFLQDVYSIHCEGGRGVVMMMGCSESGDILMWSTESVVMLVWFSEGMVMFKLSKKGCSYGHVIQWRALLVYVIHWGVVSLMRVIMRPVRAWSSLCDPGEAWLLSFYLL